MSEVAWETGYWYNGHLHYNVPYINGQQHGIAKWYHDNGLLYMEASYVNGRCHGVQRFYNEDGQLRSEIPWVNGEERNDLLGDEHKLLRLMLLGEQI